MDPITPEQPLQPVEQPVVIPLPAPVEIPQQEILLPASQLEPIPIPPASASVTIDSLSSPVPASAVAPVATIQETQPFPESPPPTAPVEANSSIPPNIDELRAKKRKRRMVGFILLIIAVLIFAALISVTFVGVKNKTTNNSATVATTAYSGTGFSFNYPNTLKTLKINEFLEIPSSSSTNLGDQVFILTAAQQDELNQAKAKIKAGSSPDLSSLYSLFATLNKTGGPGLTSVIYTASPTADCTGGVSVIVNNTDICKNPTIKIDGAKNAAEQETQTICTGDNQNFSTSNPVQDSRIETITAAGKSAYGIASEPGCNTINYAVYINLTDGGTVNINFSQAISQASLTADQEVIFNSLKIN